MDVNTPDRTDFYLMQVAFEVRRVFDKSARMDQFLIKFPDDSKLEDDRKMKIDRKLQRMEASIVRRGGFSREQVKQMVADARKRLEEQDNG